MAWLWLLAPNSTANATSSAIDAAPSGAAWLANMQHSVATAVAGEGLLVALLLAGVSAAIGLAVAVDWHPRRSAAAVVLNPAYWAIGQGLGGVLTGSGTDPNAGPCSSSWQSGCIPCSQPGSRRPDRALAEAASTPRAGTRRARGSRGRPFGRPGSAAAMRSRGRAETCG